jgi:hypothetical protein
MREKGFTTTPEERGQADTKVHKGRIRNKGLYHDPRRTGAGGHKGTRRKRKDDG